MKKITTLILCISFHTGLNAQGAASDYLDINNVKARVNATGDLFWDFMNGQFEVPKNSGAGTIYADNLWIGGYDAGNNLKIAAQTYRQNGVDFWPGPLSSTASADSAAGFNFNKVWKLRQCDITAFHNWVINGSPGTMPVDAVTYNTLQSWPAVNPLTGGSLAPYVDYNMDGMYDVTTGDYPLIKGDQAAFFVYNDKAGVHASTGGAAIGLEIQTMVYEYNCPDSALQNSIFVNYKIVNRSAFTLNNTFIGKWTNFDIGDWSDDYVGCDVTRSTYYGYNGDNMDNGFYGQHPGAQGVVFLKGAYADSNYVADPADSSVNGSGYGDGIVDNEYLGMTRFMNYANNTNPVYGNPVYANDYYDYLSGYWQDGNPWTYGGNGVGTGTRCDYLYPGDSDPNGFGVHGGMPMAPWDEVIEGDIPGDRIAIAATGPFNFSPGEIQEIEFAYVFGRDYSNTGAAAGVQIMKNRVDSIRSRYATGIVYCGCNNNSVGILNQSLSKAEFKIYPNPASTLLNLEYSGFGENVIIEIYNVQGNIISNMKAAQSSQAIDVKDLSAGLYLIKISDAKNTSVQRFVKQ